MTPLHVEKFNGKYISRAFQLLAREKQRRGVLLPSPPLDRRSQTGEERKRDFPHNAQQIEIGEFRMKFSTRGRTVENHTFEILSRRLPQPADKFRELLFWDHVFRHTFRAYEVPRFSVATSFRWLRRRRSCHHRIPQIRLRRTHLHRQIPHRGSRHPHRLRIRETRKEHDAKE
jgi:hypothetical protein